MANDNTELIRQWYRHLVHQDLDSVMDSLHPDFVNHSAARGAPADREGLQVSYGMFFFAFSTPAIQLGPLVAQGDKVAAHVIYTAVNDGEFMGNPPSQKEVSLMITEIHRIQDGQIIERWGTADMLSLMIGLGILDEPEMGLGAD